MSVAQQQQQQIVPNRSQAALTLSSLEEGGVGVGASTRYCSGLSKLDDVTPNILYESDNYVIINKPYDVRM